MPTLEQFRNEGKKFAFILDSRDVAFLDPVRLMLAKFNAINEGKIVYNTDGLGSIYPCGFEWFKEACRRAMGHFQAILNAGVLAGRIDAFLEVMPICRDIRTALIDGKPWPGIMERLYQAHGSWSKNDDQYLYHICQVYHPEYFTPDIEKHLCVHLKGFPTEEWPNDREFRDGCCAGFSSILHFPDYAGNSFWKEWIDSNGKLPDLEMKCLTIGRRRAGYGNVALDRNLGWEGKRVGLTSLCDSDETISAHANSQLHVLVREKTHLAGALNNTAVNKKDSVCVEFWVDGQCIGQLDQADRMTPFVNVYPGKHTLTIRAKGSKTSCHSLWVVRQGEMTTADLVEIEPDHTLLSET